MAEKGYVETEETVPAFASMKGNGGKGMSFSVSVVAVRKDCGYPDDAVDC